MIHENRTLIALLLATLCLSACQPIQAPTLTTAEPQTAPGTDAAMPAATPGTEVTTEHRTLTSQALAGNLLGDPAERGFSVLLPPSYTTSDKRYPVVYVLHGYYGTEHADAGEFQDVLQSAVQRGAVKEVILVFPNASNKLGGSLYLSSPTIGDYETYLTRELVDFVDANYRTLAQRDSRGITGCSMGADGAMHLALRYPDVYSVAAPYSGTYDWTKDPWLTIGARRFQGAPADLSTFWELPVETKWEIAMAAAVAPNADKPPYFLDMPYVLVDGKGELVPGFAEKVAEASPVGDAKHYVTQPLRLQGILITHGLDDYLAPIEVVREYTTLLTDLGIEHAYQEVDGTHCGMDKEPILNFMSEHLVFEAP